MNKEKKIIWFLVGLMILMGSCEKVFMDPDAKKDPVSIFEEVWTFTDRNYSFFEEKGIDWDAVYDAYRPLISDEMGSIELFDVCADMLYHLRDGHVNLLSSFDRSRYWEWYLDRPENFYYSVIERHYFKGNQRYVGPLQFVFLRNNIGYVYYGSFANPVSEGNLNLILNSLGNSPGLIIDVRHNGGGSPTNARDIASRFTEEQVFIGTNYIKNGPGHEDFRSERVYLEPHDGIRYDGPVVVLTNRKSYSATTYFAQYMRNLANVTLVGDTTGGGGGLPAFCDLPNGWLLRVSSTRFLNPEGESIEPGVPPHIVAEIPPPGNENDLTRDEILETAIELILGK